MERRRALLKRQGKSLKLVTEMLYQFWESDDWIGNEVMYLLYAEISLAGLSGASSSYVLAFEGPKTINGIPYLLVYIIPRANMTDADVSDVKTLVGLSSLDGGETPTESTEARIALDATNVEIEPQAWTLVSGTNRYRKCYYYSGGSAMAGSILITVRL